MNHFFKLSRHIFGAPANRFNQGTKFSAWVVRPMIKSLCIVCLLALNANFLVGASFAQDVSDTASVTIEVRDDMERKRGSRYVVHQYADEQCAKPKKKGKLFDKKGVKQLHTFKPLSVAANKSFIFQVSYEQKNLRHLKTCSSIANVKLQAGHNYKVVYKVSGEVLGCGMKIFDLTAGSEQVESQGVEAQVSEDPETSGLIEMDFIKPELVCLKFKKQGYKNNVPVHAERDL